MLKKPPTANLAHILRHRNDAEQTRKNVKERTTKCTEGENV